MILNALYKQTCDKRTGRTISALERSRTEPRLYRAVVPMSNRQVWNPNFSDRQLQKTVYESGFGLNPRLLPFTVVCFTGSPSGKVFYYKLYFLSSEIFLEVCLLQIHLQWCVY